MSEDVAGLVRRLMRSEDAGALATLDRETGEPYASLVLVAADHDASPVLLLSDLAAHSANIAADARVSLLFDGTAGRESRLAGARASVQGRAECTGDERARDRFLRRHPEAEGYAGFADFAFYRIAVERAHLVAGFGRIEWIRGDELLQPEAATLPLVEAEAEIVQHMNDDHGDAVTLYAAILGRRGGEGWRMTGCDSEGIDLRLGGEVCRLAFERPVRDAAQARAALVAMARRARQMRDNPPPSG